MKCQASGSWCQIILGTSTCNPLIMPFPASLPARLPGQYSSQGCTLEGKWTGNGTPEGLPLICRFFLIPSPCPTDIPLPLGERGGGEGKISSILQWRTLVLVSLHLASAGSCAVLSRMDFVWSPPLQNKFRAGIIPDLAGSGWHQERLVTSSHNTKAAEMMNSPPPYHPSKFL